MTEQKETPLSLKNAVILFRVSERSLLSLCRAGKYGARKDRGRWVLEDPPFREQALTLRAVADSLQVSRQRLRFLCESGRVGAKRIGGQWRIGLTDATTLMILRMKGMASAN